MSKQADRYQEAPRVIRRLVWSGFYSSQEIEQVIADTFYGPDDFEEERVRQWIDKEFAIKLEKQIDWPEKTDCDRLDEAFAELEELHLIALQNAGSTQSDGMEGMSEIWHERGGPDSGVVGYCFYHSQDLKRVMDGEPLYLTYGDIAGDDGKGVTIGRLICSVFEKHGFTVEWDRNIKTRIQIPGIEWKRRTPEY